MNTLQWTDALRLNHEPMDSGNRAFVVLLEQAHSATDTALPEAWAALLNHAVEHFSREDAGMRSTRFVAADHHMLEHRVVLNVMREGLVLARRGQPAAVRAMVVELGTWLARHMATQDAELARHLRQRSQAKPRARPARTSVTRASQAQQALG